MVQAGGEWMRRFWRWLYRLLFWDGSGRAYRGIVWCKLADLLKRRGRVRGIDDAEIPF